jgi:two-component system response regulator RegA
MTDAANELAQSILLVDDDDVFRERLAKAFIKRGFEVHQAGSLEDAMLLARREVPELALVDMRLPGASGLDVVRALHELDPATNIVVLTGYGSIATALDAVRLGATHYLTKPVDLGEILAAFARRDQPVMTSSAAPEAEVPSLARVEWEHIHRVLSDCQGNISQAARLLGLHRRSLQRKLSKYPVQR